ncbi:MAG: hypothetical protein LBD68_09460 [Zoogloeaceae bacterium]|nr:hypothetical protein [Zoogloeaceae bacterium]
MTLLLAEVLCGYSAPAAASVPNGGQWRSPCDAQGNLVKETQTIHRPNSPCVHVTQQTLTHTCDASGNRLTGRIVWQGRYKTWGNLALQRVAEDFVVRPTNRKESVSPQPLRMQGQYAEPETGC